MKSLEIYVSGICKGNPGKGGFAYTINDKIGIIWYRGSNITEDTTNNQMELAAVIEALKTIIKNEKLEEISIKVFSDSAYIVNCFNDNWIKKWKQNNWINSKGEKVQNQEFWDLLDDLVIKTKAKFERVKRKHPRIKNVNAIANKKIYDL